MEVPFCFRVKIDRYEIEISGTRKEVIKTIENLPQLMAYVSKAFSATNIEASATLKSSATTAYPTISSSGSCSETVVRLLETDWGKQPRTMPELIEAMKNNAMYYPPTTLSGVLVWLVKKNKIKRWKTNRGYVYALAGKEN